MFEVWIKPDEPDLLSVCANMFNRVDPMIIGPAYCLCLVLKQSWRPGPSPALLSRWFSISPRWRYMLNQLNLLDVTCRIIPVDVSGDRIIHMKNALNIGHLEGWVRVPRLPHILRGQRGKNTITMAIKTTWLRVGWSSQFLGARCLEPTSNPGCVAWFPRYLVTYNEIYGCFFSGQRNRIAWRSQHKMP